MSFDSIYNRREFSSIKWKRYGEDVIPLWIADMDFPSPPCVTEILQKEIDHGVFGYVVPHKKLIGTVLDMLKAKYNWEPEASSIVWLPGLVCALNVCCRAFSQKGKNIVTSTPIYPPFLEAPKLAERTLYTADLKIKNNRYEMEFESLETKVTDKTSLYLLCNPHNPVGRSFSKEELTKLGNLCLKHNTVICSDEIHCDLILDKSVKHTPIATINDELAQNSVTLMAPSKTWNLPGLGFSFAVIPNYKLRKRFLRAMKGIVPYPGRMGMLAAQSVYENGEPWRLELLDHLRQNRALIETFIKEKMPKIKFIPGEATYLAWLDVRELNLEKPYFYFLKHKVAFSDGADFGAPGFLRLNFATTRELIEEALNRVFTAYSQI